MCSGATFKALCYFYAGCNLFMSISAIMNANRASQIIGYDNCTTSNGTSNEDDSNVPDPICNQFTYVFLVAASGLDCFMSFLLVVGIFTRKCLLLKLYTLHLWCHMSFCFYCWLAILLAFRGAVTSSTLLSVWGAVLILASGAHVTANLLPVSSQNDTKVYFAMEVWITRGAYEAIRQQHAKQTQAAMAQSSTGSILLSMGGFGF